MEGKFAVLAGRIVLIQASSVAILAYVMQCSQWPCKVLDGIDRVNRNFLWGSLEVGKKIHKVGWQKVIEPKEEGGLGLQSTRGRNTALLAKLNWRLHTEKEAPWAQVLWKKYCSPKILNNINANKLPCFATWTTITNGMETFSKGSR